MLKKRNLLIMVLAIAIIVVMAAGCGGAATATTAPASSAPAPASSAPASSAPASVAPASSAPAASQAVTPVLNKAGKQVVVAYSQSSLQDSWRAVNQADMESWMAQSGFKFITANADTDTSKQLTDIQSLLAQKPDVLVMSPWESTALTPAVGFCDAAQIPLIVIDRTIDIQPGTGMYITAITQSHEYSGQKLAEKAVEICTARYGEPKGSVVHVEGAAGASPVIDANKGFDAGLAATPNIKTIATTDTQFTRANSLTAMQDFMTKYPAGKIDIVRTDWSDQTLGVIDAIQAAGRTEILGSIVGEGGKLEALEAVAAGFIARETQTPPYFGQQVAESVLKIVAGEKVEPKQTLNIKIFDASDKATVDAYLAQIKAAGLSF